MPAESVDTEHQRESKARPLIWFLARGLESPTSRPKAWDLVRALALVGFVFFAAASSFSWLRLSITTPLKHERINPRDAYDISPIEQDLALLRRWLPVEGKVGYLSDRPEGPRYELRYRLAPLLLDYNWAKHDWVLVDYPVGQGATLIGLSRYRLVTALPEAKSFARGMLIYRRNP